jgi:uncharacterized cupin superfamily protein
MANNNSAASALPSTLPMRPYVPGMDVGELEDWPFTNPASNYIIHEGTPAASGRIDVLTDTTRVGVWKCTKGSFECVEQGDELMTILSGHVRVTDVANGQVVELRAGDSMFSSNGKRVIWQILSEHVTKVFYGCKSDGF